MAVATRQCTVPTKSGGQCPVAPVTGEDWCMGHAPEEVRVAKGFTGDAGRLGGRPRIIRSVERMQQLEDQEWERLGRVHIDIALDPDAEPALRLRALEYVHDRLVGKTIARTETELSGTIGLDLLLADQPNDNADNTKFEEEA